MMHRIALPEQEAVGCHSQAPTAGEDAYGQQPMSRGHDGLDAAQEKLIHLGKLTTILFTSASQLYGRLRSVNAEHQVHSQIAVESKARRGAPC